MALPILNPGFCPSPGELTLHGPQASSGPGFATAPQVTGTLFLAAFVRSLGLPLSPASAPPLHSTVAHPLLHTPPGYVRPEPIPAHMLALGKGCRAASLTLLWLPEAGGRVVP